MQGNAACSLCPSVLLPRFRYSDRGEGAVGLYKHSLALWCYLCLAWLSFPLGDGTLLQVQFLPPRLPSHQEPSLAIPVLFHQYSVVWHSVDAQLICIQCIDVYF